MMAGRYSAITIAETYAWSPVRSRMRNCSATRPAQVPRFVTASASQNEKNRQPDGPITARRTDESARCIAGAWYA